MADLVPAQAFRDMAERIDRNVAEEFGGCVLIVSPDGKVLDVLLVGSRPDPVAFWATAKVRVGEAADNAVFELEQAHKNVGGFRRA